MNFKLWTVRSFGSSNIFGYIDSSKVTMSRTSSNELTDFEDGTWAEAGHDPQSLPRVDGGKQAWLFLSACFMIEALVWGKVHAS